MVKCAFWISVPVDQAEIVRYLVNAFSVAEPLKASSLKHVTMKALADYLTAEGKKHEQAVAKATEEANKLEDEAEKGAALEATKARAETGQAKALRARVTELVGAAKGAWSTYVWNEFLEDTFPKFLYFDEYYQMTGHDNVQALKKRKESGHLEEPEHPLLGLIELARLDLDALLNVSRTQELKNKLQGASNYLTSQILKYWSQNKHHRMPFDVRPALPDDPEGMTSGINIWGEVEDTKHLASTGLGTRSRRFVWFFSFLAWYSAVKKKDEPLILLLDEPGLSLHGKAQEDLLRYFEREIVSNPKHQLIYTTHSPLYGRSPPLRARAYCPRQGHRCG